MIIRNFQSLSTNSAKKDALSIIEAGLVAADPKIHLEKIIKKGVLILPGKKVSLENYSHVFVIAMGKAGHTMARAADSLMRVDGGIVVVPDKIKTMAKKFKVIQA